MPNARVANPKFQTIAGIIWFLAVYAESAAEKLRAKAVPIKIPKFGILPVNLYL